MNRWWLRLTHHVAPYTLRISVLVLLVLMGAGLTVLMPWPMKLIVDYVLTAEPLPENLAWLNILT